MPLFAILSMILSAEPPKPAYPPSRVDEVVDTLHGVKITDPYRWLEDGTSPATQEWTKKQNAFSREWLDALPGRDKLRATLDRFLDVGGVSSPVPRGSRVFYMKREGKQNQPILYVDVTSGEKRTSEVVIDPNNLSKDATTTLDWWFPSRDGALVAYGLSEGGSEQSTLRIRDLATGKDLPDIIERTRACSLAWNPDGKGFFYTRYPKPGSVPKGQENYNRRVYFHKLGDDSANDALVFGEGRNAADWPQVALSPDGRWLVVTVEKGWAKSEVYFKDMLKNEDFVTLVENVEATFKVVPRDDRIYLLTNEKAPNYKVLAVEPQKPKRENWKEIIPQSDDILEGVLPIGNVLVAHRSLLFRSTLMTYSRDGKPLGDGAVTYSSSYGSLSGEATGKEVYYTLQSYLVPSMIEKRSIEPKGLGASEVWKEVTAPFKQGTLVVYHVGVRSKDGTDIPLTLIHKRGMKPDGKTPTVLYGYGGFNISLFPTFNPTRFLTICEYGGIMAIANLRGGGERGETWHEAGMLAKKQNVFDDFIAAAEYLIEKKLTDRDHLAIMGRSNGGLLVGAAVTQRPDLFKAAVCGVPLLDMLRYHKFLIAKLWIPEYGDPDDADEFKTLHAYSPYHRVKNDTKYPAVLFATAESDTRVDPLHARKMTALMQAATSSDRPILLRLEDKAGHGQGKPRSKLLDEEVDTWSFLLNELGVKP